MFLLWYDIGMKKLRILIIIVLALLALGLYTLGSETFNDETRFAGELQEVNTSCFADGECYAVVDGNKVTLLVGWSQETVGQVIGSTDGIGGLQNHLGERVEVFAATTEGGYTLYGNEDYYLKVGE
jgi:hypothetical protein